MRRQALGAALEQDLELVQSSEQCLLEDSRNKEELIRGLMRTVHSEGAERPKRGMLQKLASKLGGHSGQKAEIAELEHVAEEAMQDNLRLRTPPRMDTGLYLSGFRVYYCCYVL